MSSVVPGVVPVVSVSPGGTAPIESTIVPVEAVAAAPSIEGGITPIVSTIVGAESVGTGAVAFVFFWGGAARRLYDVVLTPIVEVRARSASSSYG